MTRTADLAKAMLDANQRPNGSDIALPDGGDLPEQSMEPFRPFPVDALPATIAGFVSSVAGATGTDPAWAALAALTVIAGCIGNRAAIVLKHGWIEPAILWAALVGKSGSIKSVVVRLVTRPLVDLFKMEREAFARNMRQYLVESDQYEAAMTEWKRIQKQGTPTDPPLEPEKPREKRVLVSDITIEKLAALLGETPLGLLLVRDELAGLVNSFDRYAGGKGSDLQSWLSMNDGGPLLVDRKSDGSTFVERASVSLLGTIQPFTLRKVFGAAEREAGLLARILLTYPPDQPTLWTDEELRDDVVADWRELLAALLSLEPACDDAGSPRPRFIGLAGDAKKRFIDWHDRHAREVADLKDDHLRAHWSKLKGTCARIALLLACTEASIGASVSAVSLDCIKRSIAVIEWLKGESARIYGALGEPGNSREHQWLVEWIKRRGGAVTVRDLTHGVWSLRGNAEAARAGLDELVRSGLGRWVDASPGIGGGRPAEQFELTYSETSPSPKPPVAAP